MADIELTPEDRGLAEELERLKRRLEEEDLDVELWYPIRKAADLADAGRWLLEITLAKGITDEFYPVLKQFLKEWFTETPVTEKRPLHVRVRLDDNLEPFDQFDLD